MKSELTLLIADRNAHVRNFLKRELQAEGWRVLLAHSGREVLELAFRHEHIDLLIIDPDLPGVSEATLFAKLQDRIPPLPTVIHAFAREAGELKMLPADCIFVEKRANSVDHLKQLVADMLKAGTVSF
jgi:CheY-like chemotaxis protein